MRTNYMKIIFITVLAVFVSLQSSFAAIYISGNAPSTQGANAALDTALRDAFNDALDEARNNRLNIYANQPDLARGFGDSAAMATNAASLNGYQNYDLFAVAYGLMLTIQAPDITFDDKKYEDDLKKDGDIYAGVGLAPVVFNVGLNLGLLVENLYMNVKFGRYEWEDTEVSENKFKSVIFGAGLNYGIIGDKSVLAGLARWRGISLGAGFYYHNNVFHVETELDEVRQNIVGYGVDLVVNPDFGIESNAKVYVVPLEIATSFQLLWLMNLNFGAGVDIIWGETDLVYTTRGDVVVDGTLPTTPTPGNVVVSGGTKDEAPTNLRAKLIAGVGINFGPVKVDVPLVYYHEAGFAAGLTVACVW